MDEKQFHKLAGYMVIGLVFVAVFGLITTVAAFVNANDFTGAGLGLVAMAISFSAILNALKK